MHQHHPLVGDDENITIFLVTKTNLANLLKKFLLEGIFNIGKIDAAADNWIIGSGGAGLADTVDNPLNFAFNQLFLAVDKFFANIICLPPVQRILYSLQRPIGDIKKSLEESNKPGHDALSFLGSFTRFTKS
ncbi:MAG: hypothetical protein U9Q39_01435 [Pseudomonadota bacterium]|nr:hypothetical protein [Pseudomonadota bacterium]